MNQNNNLLTNSKTLSIASFNIAHGRGTTFHQMLCSKKTILKNCNRIAHLLEKLRADIVLLQEIDFSAPWSKYINQLNTINHQNSYPYQAIGNNQQQNYFLKFAYGNAILSKIPLLNIYNHPFNHHAIGSKGFLFSEIPYLNQKLALINLHLHHISTQQRNIQLEYIREKITSHKGPIIVGGDFNTNITDKHLKKFLLQNNLHFHENQTPTFSLFGKKIKMDHLFASQEIQWLTSDTIPTILSDHHCIINRFTIKTH